MQDHTSVPKTDFDSDETSFHACKKPDECIACAFKFLECWHRLANNACINP